VSGRPDAISRLAVADLSPVVDELARRYCEGDEPRSITLRSAPEPTMQAVADLFGLDRLPRPGARLHVDRLAASLGLAGPAELRDAVETLRGPLHDRRAARIAERGARTELWEWFAAAAANLPIGDLSTWISAVRAAGVRGDIPTHRERLHRALTVLQSLPADGVPLAMLAAGCTGDPHALDARRPLAALVLDALALAAGEAPATDAESARSLWERMGVIPDPLSSTVLALGVPGADGPADAWLSAAAAASEPVVLTLSQLRRWPIRPLAAGNVGYVVENPSLIATAAARGWTGPPLICSSGRPTMAVVLLLGQLAGHGATLRQHADFDPAGVDISRWLAERAGTVPWRMSRDDYINGIEYATEASITGLVPQTPWDPSLAGEMAARRIVVYEESLVESLLASMSAST
jgi:uncharacterized protein (TIGR02679 family)